MSRIRRVSPVRGRPRGFQDSRAFQRLDEHEDDRPLNYRDHRNWKFQPDMDQPVNWQLHPATHDAQQLQGSTAAKYFGGMPHDHSSVNGPPFYSLQPPAAAFMGDSRGGFPASSESAGPTSLSSAGNNSSSDIYESIYDTRWRLLSQEAARLSRETTSSSSSSLQPSSVQPTQSWSTPQHPQHPQQLQQLQQLHHQTRSSNNVPFTGPGHGLYSSSSRESSLGPGSSASSINSSHATAKALVLSTRSPRNIAVARGSRGFGFTLRHFIVYPPDEDDPLSQNQGALKEPIDTIFVKGVKYDGPAYAAGLRIGDRLVSVNGDSILGKSYSHVVQLIKRTVDTLRLVVVPQEEDALQMYFSEMAQNPETNQRPAKHSEPRQAPEPSPAREPQHFDLQGDDHVYAVPAVVREEPPAPEARLPEETAARRHKTAELKEEFLRRPTLGPCYPAAVAIKKPQKASMVTRRRASDILPPVPAMSAHVHAANSSSHSALKRSHAFSARSQENSPEEHEKPEDSGEAAAESATQKLDCVGLREESASTATVALATPVSETPKLLRKSSLASPERRRSSENPLSQRTSFTGSSEECYSESPSSRKSSYSLSGASIGGTRKRSSISKDGKQFAVTFFVSENDKTKLVDILHKESVAEALTSILETWVNREEEEGREEERALQELIERQKEQVDEMRREGREPPVRIIPTVVSPVPEETEEEENEDTSYYSGGKGIDDDIATDISVQEFRTGEENILQPPTAKVQQPQPQPLHQAAGLRMRSLTPSNAVPRHHFSHLPEADLYPPSLKRPSSHYDESAHAAHSRPVSPLQQQQQQGISRPTSPSTKDVGKVERGDVVDTSEGSDATNCTRVKPHTSYPCILTVKAPLVTETYPSIVTTTTDSQSDCVLKMIQRPESMTVPIGGVWRPEDELDEPGDLFADLATNAATSSPMKLATSYEEGVPPRRRSHDVLSALEMFGPGRVDSGDRIADASEEPSSVCVSGSSRRSSSEVLGAVVRRRTSKNQHQLSADELEERNVRRISYIKATKEEDYQDSEGHHQSLSQTAIGEEEDEEAHSNEQGRRESVASTKKHSTSLASSEKYQSSVEPSSPTSEPLVKEGWLTVKVTAIDGKKATDRSWKMVYAVLRSKAMYMYKDKKMAVEHPHTFEEAPVSLSESSHIEVAEDYTKRKHVFRVRTEAGSEYLFQAEGDSAMQSWITALESTSAALAIVMVNRSDADGQQGRGRQLQQQQQTGKTGSLKKLTSFRNRSPSAHSHSPAAKARKASHAEASSSTTHISKESSVSTAAITPSSGTTPTTGNKKTWRGKMARQLKKIHPGGASPSSSASSKGASSASSGAFGVPLEDCILCDEPEYERVPLLVRTCCSIVEERGLEIVGVYRVPGNSAAVSNLTEQVNRSTDGVLNLDEDPRWGDVNVVSSLLKSFFRKLPEPLFTSELYPVFIEASKQEDATLRLNTLKKLVHNLPDIYYDTLRHVCKHLCKVVDHSDVNKMEVRNLAIVFGPTLVRTGDPDNMAAMVTDMSQQCRIIESILSNCEWFFADAAEVDIDYNIPTMALENQDSAVNTAPVSATGNESLLLTNLQKLEEQGKVGHNHSPAREVRPKDIVSGIISAANRKMQRTSVTTKSSPSALLQNIHSEDTSSASYSSHLGTTASGGGGGSCNSGASSRRNSESVIQGAMTIAAAVPQLVGSVSSISAEVGATSASVPKPDSPLVNRQLQAPFKEMLSVSAENINKVNLAVSVMSAAASKKQQQAEQDKHKSPFPIDSYSGLQAQTAERVRRFENETRAMLNMRAASGSASMLSESFPDIPQESSTTTTVATSSDLDGGILLQEPYQAPASYTSASSAASSSSTGTTSSPSTSRRMSQLKDRFLNLTYLSGSSSSSSSSEGNPQGSRRKQLMRGFSLGSILSSSSGFDTQKIAGSGTLKRLHRFQKANTEGSLPMSSNKSKNASVGSPSTPSTPSTPVIAEVSVPKLTREPSVPEEVPELPNEETALVASAVCVSDVEEEEEVLKELLVESEKERDESEYQDQDTNQENKQLEEPVDKDPESDMLSSISATFDEKLRLLLDPHYPSPSPNTSPPKPKEVVHLRRKISDNNLPEESRKRREEALRKLKARSVSVCGTTPADNSLIIREPSDMKATSCPRKVDLKRGRFVDKHKEKPFIYHHHHPTHLETVPVPPTANTTSSLKRTDSLTKKEKQDENEARKRIKESGPATAKLLKTLANQKRIRRRHTVGGTKDFAEWEEIVKNTENAIKSDRLVAQHPKGASDDSRKLELNLMAYLLRASSPDLNNKEASASSSSGLVVRRRDMGRSTVNAADPRRLSLPDTVLDGKSLKMTSLLESQI